VLTTLKCIRGGQASGSEPHRLSGGDKVRCNEQVVHQFRNIARADGPTCTARADIASSHRCAIGKIDFLAADHHGQRAFGAPEATAYRRIEQRVTRLGQARGTAARGARSEVEYRSPPPPVAPLEQNPPSAVTTASTSLA